jgi:hypothetical protein
VDDVILETRGLTKELRGFVAVKNVEDGHPGRAARHAARARSISATLTDGHREFGRLLKCPL